MFDELWCKWRVARMPGQVYQANVGMLARVHNPSVDVQREREGEREKRERE